MPSSNTGRLHAILLIRNHSFFGRRTPAHGSGLRRSGPTSKRSGCPRPNRRHVFLQRQRQDADLARPARCVSNPRKRPAATDTNPANAVWPARANRLWKFAGVLGRRKFRIKADHVSPLPQTCQHGPSLQSLSCVSPCSRPFPAQLAYGAGLSPQRPVSLRKTVTESRHPSLGPSDPEGSGVPSFLSLQLFSDRSAS